VSTSTDTRAALEVAQVFATVAADFASQPDTRAMERRVASVASKVVGCRWTQVAKITERGTIAFHDTDDPTLRLVRMAAEESDGGIEAHTLAERDTIAVEDMTNEDRWPDYCGRIATETEVRSALSLPLRLADVDLGVLAMYSPDVSFFDDRSVEVGGLLAEHASVALSHVSYVDRAHNLEIALMTNRKIGMAIGVLMASRNVTDIEAFDLLRTTSQHTHAKLRDVAEYVTMAGELPTTEDDSTLPKVLLQDSA